ncbi:MAG: hypothetical protein RMK74_04915, partial [Myxococcales bacterium]|nr:hypothetical protein [Myxococcales bacterium]
PGAMTSATFHVAGRYTLADPAGRTLTVAANLHGGTPLDCGRSECHAAEAQAALRSPMHDAWARLLEDPLAPRRPDCALGCHATGEPGAPDGGFAHLAAQWNWHVPAGSEPGASVRMPRELRRLSGVGCTACHGPGAIPEPDAAWAIHRAEVCAVCHDAPPRYGHFVAWQSNRMARADAHPEARRNLRCARCHTTAGWLASLANRPIQPQRLPPESTPPVGVACVACHAPHAERTHGPLLRRPSVPLVLASASAADALRDGPAGVCLSCHAPSAGDGGPSSSAAALLLGRGGWRADGAPLHASAPHAFAPRGCLVCHDGGPDGLQRGASHGWRATPAVCSRCHDPSRTAAREELLARTLALASRLGLDANAPHVPMPVDAGTPIDRARWNVALVLEDRAAWAHGPGYARALLEEAERALTDAGVPRASATTRRR